MAKLIIRDKKGELEAISNEWIEKEKQFHVLSKIKILFVWKLGDTPDYDDEGTPIAATTRVLPKRERDIYSYDVEIKVFKATWRKRGPKSKRRLIWHELFHIELQEGENFKVARDDDGRVIVKIRPHTVTVNTFEEEIERFGILGRDVPDALVLSRALKKKRKEKNASH